MQADQQGGVPNPGATAAVLLDVVWSLFQVESSWPIWRKVDQELYRRGEDWDKSINDVDATLIHGTDLRRPKPRNGEPVMLTIGGISCLPSGGEHVRTFMALVAFAAEWHKHWDSGDDREPRFTAADAKRVIPLPPGRKGDTLLTQLLSVIDAEPWCDGFSGDGAEREYIVNRGIRRFSRTRSLNLYWDVRSALTEPQVNNIAEPEAPLAAAPTSYVRSELIAEIRGTSNPKWNTSKLVQLAEELQSNFAAGNALSAQMDLRAIIDHIPPLFGQQSYAAVVSNYSGTDADKKYLRRLMDVRTPADDALHRQIGRRDSYLALDDLPLPPCINALLAACLERLRLP